MARDRSRHFGGSFGLGARHGGEHGPGPRAARLQRWIRTVARVGLAGLVVAAVVIVEVPGTTRVAGAASLSCPEGANQCVPATPPGCTTSPCPSALVGPTTDVADGAYIYVQLADFPAGDWVSIEFCPANQASNPDPVCANDPNGFAGINFVTAISKLLPDGSGLLSFQVTSDPPGEGSPGIPGIDVDNQQSQATPFFCDNSQANACGLEITDIGQGTGSNAGNRPVTLPPFTSSNTMVVPLTFEAASTGCPSTDPIIDTEGSFSIEQFLPSAVEATCADPSTGVVGLNISLDSESVVSDFASGIAPLVFTDDPNDPSEQSALTGSKYVLIPVAASASVVAFLSASELNVNSTEVPSPESSYNLTPNMVAGMLTTAYTSSYGSDLLVPPLTCQEVGCGKNPGNASTFNLLNPVPSGSDGPSSLLSGFSSVATGSSDETTGWLCSMPNVSLSVKNTKGKALSVVDPNMAATTLTTPGVNVDPWPFPDCSSYPVIPTLGKNQGNYQPAQTPAGQAEKIRAQWGGGSESPTPGLLGTNSAAGFGAMDWGDAAYFGLNAANLLNAAGKFVAPSTTSIDAALNDATELPNGTLAYNYATTDPNAYPTPMVTYALLSTSPQPHDQVVDETNLLTNLVNFSHNPTGDVPLPAGYVPLPDNLYTQATNDIQTALTSIPAPPPTLPGAGSTTAPSAGSTPGTQGAGSPSPQPSGSNLSPTQSTVGLSNVHIQQPGAQTSSSVSSVAKAEPSPKHANPGFVPRIISLLGGRDRWLLPLLLGAMILSLPSGSLVLVATKARRRLARGKPTVPESAT